MNTWSFPHESQNKNEADPLTYTNKEINKMNLENIINEEKPQEIDNQKEKEKVSIDKTNKYYKDLNCEGQKTNEFQFISFKGSPKEETEIKVENDNKKIEIGNSQKIQSEGDIYIKDNNYKEVENENDDNSYDDYFYISELIPPQNFSEKLKKIKIKYQKLKEEIEWLKKENKKYNPNFIIKKNKYNS